MRDASGDETDEDESSMGTARLVLRRPRMADAAAIADALGNEHVAMNLIAVPYPYRKADAEAWIARQRADGAGADWVAVDRAQRLIGAAFHGPTEAHAEGFELAFWVAEPYWGRGFGTEIAHAVIDHAFEQCRVDRLWSVVRVTNGRGRRVAEKCGFQFRDAGMVRSFATRGAVPVERFVLERRVWRSLKSWGTAGQGRERPAGRVQFADTKDESDAA